MQVKVVFGRHGKFSESTFEDAKAAAKAIQSEEWSDSGAAWSVDGSREKVKEVSQAGQDFFHSRASWWDSEDRAKAHAGWCAFCRKNA